jgi:hypothetical protein
VLLLCTISWACHPYLAFPLTLDPFGYPGQPSCSTTGHSTHPRPLWNQVQTIWPPYGPSISLCTGSTHSAIQGPCLDQVTIAKAAPLFTVVSPVAGSHTVTTGSPRDRFGPEASRLGLSLWAGPSVTRSARVSQIWYGGIKVMILTKGKPVPLAWGFIYKLGEVMRGTSTILADMGRKCVTYT